MGLGWRVSNGVGLPLLENKLVKGDTRIYVCVDKACQLPVAEVVEAVLRME
ncbi:MAG: hypothetical protein K9G46_09425 [Flavobacteriales bacterium]|jgi:uncharacterized protein YyaL (SSP411 family)|nr:hypothetical protein [Flavobacteriales bacterium]